MINELLARGRKNAIPARDLIAVLNVDTRDFYNAVERERRQGIPICAAKTAPAGFYLAKDRQEAEEYARQVSNTAREMQKTARVIRKTAQQLPE